jgi:hypothetical protein
MASKSFRTGTEESRQARIPSTLDVVWVIIDEQQVPCCQPQAWSAKMRCDFFHVSILICCHPCHDTKVVRDLRAKGFEHDPTDQRFSSKDFGDPTIRECLERFRVVV